MHASPLLLIFQIYNFWSVWQDTSEDNVLSKADAIVVALGTDEDPYSKSTCFQVCGHDCYHFILFYSIHIFIYGATRSKN